MADTTVLFLTRKWPPAVGGMEVYCHELANELRKRLDVDLCVLPGRADGRPPSAATLIRFGFTTAVRLLTHRTRADVVHGGDIAVWPLVWLATLRSQAVRTVLSAHGTDIALANRHGIVATLYRFYVRIATFALPNVVVLANSRATARLCEASGFRSVSVVPLAARVRGHAHAAHQHYILFVGRLMRRKGCAWFIEHVLPLLDPSLKLVVAGVAWDANEQRALQHPRVHFLGPVFGRELARLRADATAVVVPNLDIGTEGFEGFGLTAVEAAGDGGVVLASDIDGISDAVRNGKTGFLLPAGDAKQWADKIRDVSCWTDAQRRAFVETSRASVDKYYSWRRVADETIAAYKFESRQQNATRPVSVTVVVPVYGAGPHLEAVIAALQRQSPSISGIIISHSGVGDPSARLAGIDGVTVLHSPERLFAGAARNRGLALVETEWVAFVDEDIIVDDRWHAALQAAIARGNADCVVGSIGCASSGGYWGMSLWFTEFGSVHPYLGARRISSGASANLALLTDAIRNVDGFPEDWRVGEDALTQARLESTGARIRFDPAVVGYHHNRRGVREVLRYSFILGLNSARLRRLYPHLTGATAVRWPPFSLGLWIARLAQIHWRVVTSRGGPLASLIFYTPGILMAVLAWNFGFTRAAFEGASGSMATRRPTRANLGDINRG